MTKQVRADQLTTGAWVVQIWLVTGYNHDPKDVLAGGSRRLGPFAWVLEGHKLKFLAAMRRQFGNDDRVCNIEVGERAFTPMKKLPTLDQELWRFRRFLAREPNWADQD